MSAVAIQTALEVALAAISPALPTAHENNGFAKPADGSAYQEAWFLPAKPEALEASGRWRREQGIFQVTLKYPPKGGSLAAKTRADLIQSTFYHGRAIVGTGVVVQIGAPPEIGAGRNEDDRYVVPVKIPFYSNILRS